MDSRINSILSQHPEIFAGIKIKTDDVVTMKNIIVAKLNYYKVLLSDNLSDVDDDDVIISILKRNGDVDSITSINIDNIKLWVTKVQYPPKPHKIYTYNFDVMPILDEGKDKDTEIDIYIKAYRMMDNMLSIYTMKLLRQLDQYKSEYKPIYQRIQEPPLCHYKAGDECVLNMHFTPVEPQQKSVIIYVPGIGSDISTTKASLDNNIVFHFFDYGSRGVFSNVVSVVRNATAVKQSAKPMKILDDPKDRVNRLADLIRLYTNINLAKYLDIHCDSHGSLVTYRAILLLRQMGDAPNLHKIRIFAKSPPRQLPKALVPMGCINFYHNRDGFYNLFKLSTKLKIKLFDIMVIEKGDEPDVVFDEGKFATLVIRNKKYIQNIDYYDFAYFNIYAKLLNGNVSNIDGNVSNIAKIVSNIARIKKKNTGYYHISNNMLYSALSEKYFILLTNVLNYVFINDGQRRN